MENVQALNEAHKQSYEYQLSNAKVFSLNEILCYSNLASEDAGGDLSFRTFNRKEFENMAKERFIQTPVQSLKPNIEFNRYKQDCRKKALEFGANTAFRDVSNNSSESVLIEADKYYKWLISIPEN